MFRPVWSHLQRYRSHTTHEMAAGFILHLQPAVIPLSCMWFISLMIASHRSKDVRSDMVNKQNNVQYVQTCCVRRRWFDNHHCMCVCELDICKFNPLKPELNSICYLLALLGAHHFLHVSRIRVKSLTLRWLMSYIYGAPILDVSRSHTTTHHSR